MVSRLVFNRAEYRANPETVAQIEFERSSGKSCMRSRIALRAGYFNTRSAMSHMPFSIAPPPANMTPSKSF